MQRVSKQNNTHFWKLEFILSMQLLVSAEDSAVPDDYLLELSFTVLTHKFINSYSKFKVVLKVSCNIAAQ